MYGLKPVPFKPNDYFVLAIMAIIGAACVAAEGSGFEREPRRSIEDAFVEGGH
jgi:hypothetical protein